MRGAGLEKFPKRVRVEARGRAGFDEKLKEDNEVRKAGVTDCAQHVHKKCRKGGSWYRSCPLSVFSSENEFRCQEHPVRWRERLQSAEVEKALGILRLRGRSALRSGHYAQDDNSVSKAVTIISSKS